LKIKNFLPVLIVFFIGLSAVAQTARIKGIILDEENHPVNNVTVTAGDVSTVTNESGFYLLTIPARAEVTVVFTHEILKKVTTRIQLKSNEDYELDFIMTRDAEQLSDVVISSANRKAVQGLTVIQPDVIRKMAGANAGVENIIKTLPGVYSNNELSTQYAVRGGNYDENLVYVNEVEIYRPFLIRSGQQEGLSFTNSDLVQNVEF
jgi:hypothetical protein